MPKSGIPITRKSIWAIPPEEEKTDATLADILKLDTAIKQKLGKHNAESPDSEEGTSDVYQYFPEPTPDIFEGDEADPLEPAEPDDTLKEADEYTPEEVDEYLTAELLMPHGDKMQHARVIRHAKN